MAKPPPIGVYRHTPGGYIPPGGSPGMRPPRRRRFPYLGVVFLAYGLLGPAVCAAVSWGFIASGQARMLPARFSGTPMPPAPSLENVLFGAGLHETALASGLVGLLLFRMIWSTRLPEARLQRGFGGVFPGLLGPSLILGVSFSLLGLLIGMYGFYLRTAPPNQPLPVRMVLGIPGALIMSFGAFFTGTVPLVLVALGLLLGLGTAITVALLWPRFPEELDLRKT